MLLLFNYWNGIKMNNIYNILSKIAKHLDSNNINNNYLELVTWFKKN